MDTNTVEQCRMGFLIEVLVFQKRNLAPVHRELNDVVINLADDLARSEYKDSQQGVKGFFGRSMQIKIRRQSFANRRGETRLADQVGLTELKQELLAFMHRALVRRPEEPDVCLCFRR